MDNPIIAATPAIGRTIWDFLSDLLELFQSLVHTNLAAQAAELAQLNLRIQDLTIHIQETMTLTQKQFDDVIDTLDAATTKGAAVATAIQDTLTQLRAAIAGQGLPAATEQAILDRLTASATAAAGLSAALSQMAADPTNPVPIPVPDPPPAAPVAS